MAFRWQTDDVPLIVVFGSSLPSTTKKKHCQKWIPLSKLSLMFFVLKLGVYVRLVKSLLVLSFLFIKTVKEVLKKSKSGVKTSITL